MDHLTSAQTKEFPSSFGPITCKIPSLKQRLEVSKRMQRYAEGLSLTAADWDLIETMALLDILATEVPESFKRDKVTGGWDYDLLYDLDPIISLGSEVKKWVESFRQTV